MKESKDEDKQGAHGWGQAVHGRAYEGRQSRKDPATEQMRGSRTFQREPHGTRMGVVVFLHL